MDEMKGMQTRTNALAGDNGALYSTVFSNEQDNSRIYKSISLTVYQPESADTEELWRVMTLGLHYSADKVAGI